jgi:AcrR family transcriptional regulator
LDSILKKTDMTKGALYHHFKNKKELGYAVVDTLIHDKMMAEWVEPLKDCHDPVDTLTQLVISSREEVMEKYTLGCPLVNIGQQMSSVDEGFRQRVDNIYRLWIDAISETLLRGQMNGKVSRKIAPDQAACFFVAAAEGTLVLGKVTRSEEIMSNNAFALMQYLDTLRP